MSLYVTDGEGNLKKLTGIIGDTSNLATKEMILNPNLLINGDFRVNQRGQTSYVMKEGAYVKQYTLDRWYITAGGTQANKGTVTVESDGILFTSNVAYGEIGQYIEDWKILRGKTVTLSCKTNDAKGFRLIAYAGNTQLAIAAIETELTVITFTIPNDLSSPMRILINNGAQAPTGSIKLYYVKLELGSVATPNSPRPYAEELVMCQRYYRKYITGGFFGYGLSNTTARLYIDKGMRTQPTLLYSDLSLQRVYSNGQSITPTNVTVFKMEHDQIICTVTATNLAYAQPIIYFTGDNGYFELDAEM